MVKGLMLVNNNVEDVEALATRALLVRAGFQIDTFTLENTLNLKTAYGLDFSANYLISDVNELDYDFIILPGGKHVLNWIDNSNNLSNLINKFYMSKKLVSAICAAPLFLDKINLLENKNYTMFHGMEENVNGNFEINEKVVKFNNIITARSAGVMYEFVFEIVKYFKGEEELMKLKANIIY